LPDNYFSRLPLERAKLSSLLDTINEIDSLDIPMIDVLNILEKLNILKKDDWRG